MERDVPGGPGLGFRAPNAGDPGMIPGQGIRSHMYSQINIFFLKMKIGDIEGTFHARMGMIKEMVRTEQKQKRLRTSLYKNYTKRF